MILLGVADGVMILMVQVEVVAGDGYGVGDGVGGEGVVRGVGFML